LKFIDESGVNLAMTRLYGRTPKGMRVIGSVPQSYGQNVTMVAALGNHGLQAMMTGEGATDAAVFRAYVKHVLGPTLSPGDIVVLDNLGRTKPWAASRCWRGGASGSCIGPPYSLDLAPIEPCWSKVKTALRQAKARTRAALDGAIAAALATIYENRSKAIKIYLF
jgi:transposase